MHQFPHDLQISANVEHVFRVCWNIGSKSSYFRVSAYLAKKNFAPKLHRESLDCVSILVTRPISHTQNNHHGYSADAYILSLHHQGAAPISIYCSRAALQTLDNRPRLRFYTNWDITLLKSIHLCACPQFSTCNIKKALWISTSSFCRCNSGWWAWWCLHPRLRRSLKAYLRRF